MMQMINENGSMKFFNINLKGLNGRPQPSLLHISTAHVYTLDVYTLEKKTNFQGGDLKCSFCSNKDSENIVHIISMCKAYSELRKRKFNEM